MIVTIKMNVTVTVMAMKRNDGVTNSFSLEWVFDGEVFYGCYSTRHRCCVYHLSFRFHCYPLRCCSYFIRSMMIKLGRNRISALPSIVSICCCYYSVFLFYIPLPFLFFVFRTTVLLRFNSSPSWKKEANHTTVDYDDHNEWWYWVGEEEGCYSMEVLGESNESRRNRIKIVINKFYVISTGSLVY